MSTTRLHNKVAAVLTGAAHGDAWVSFSSDGSRWASFIGPGLWDDVNLTDYTMLELWER